MLPTEVIMFEELGVALITILLAWFIWYLEFGKTFKANYRLRKKMRDLVKRANNGDKSAQRKCDNSCYVNKRVVHCENKVNMKTHYSVSYKVL
ncbi:MAG: hypothetical protein COV32_00540 [Candidatus Yonathbacteria bacterium CG10_big_fil_rev_8_21_14_0_10_43_136]|uniref:Uncharacterized protein n=2 Tax=Parcubacteria group TaxID=1794811 RepID=A0A2M7Q5C3_9BACT|nr:MAG: hypothetical protein AUK15_00305 [Candidatus Nomurabacteria bacterium CG2_30_43_9]PIQ35708.1 MAG: hypothetical protein COW60_02450 [Candidatus Yonathbacteria bacterium CG17_big_fil_post_rev_8_21_14_2_50_43_9]PIR40926.1 MAG: hypothetical protein COV32_00540 [Candidatus Yonathbacteria bacterium CG10_big_fil_rev_8_21_14_0_10_43_136]PIX57377.1 MAG: hypothetical protein COZ48_00800 [Candidatus Yonathbacteria bacterium CG_4_10_14_3_um_filter_43_12]PIY58282.1 MAG: hypothetical protein COY98_02